MKEFTFLASDNKKIAAYTWPAHGKCIATVQILHGMSEHALRYDHFAQFLTKQGFTIYAHDHRGHGKTVRDDEPYMYFKKEQGWEQVTEDVDTLATTITIDHPEIPHFIFSHSMGTFLARTLLATTQNTFAGVILSGTAGSMGKFMHHVGVWLSWLEKKRIGEIEPSLLFTSIAFGNYNARYHPPRTWEDWLTRDEEVVDTFVADPLCNHPNTASFYHDLMRGLRFVQSKKCYKSWDKSIPILLMAGDGDPVGNYGKGPIQVYKKLKKYRHSDVALQLYANARHELVNELNRDEVYSAINEWMAYRLS